MNGFATFDGFSGYGGLSIVRGVVKYASPKDTHGPVVKSGPTAGQNRSRNKDGTWRKKRSDAGHPRVKR